MEFVNWNTLATQSGAAAMVMAVTQLTKNLPMVSELPTRLWSFIVSLAVHIPAVCVTAEKIDAGVVILAVFNAVIVSLTANAAHDISGTDK